MIFLPYKVKQIRKNGGPSYHHFAEFDPNSEFSAIHKNLKKKNVFLEFFKAWVRHKRQKMPKGFGK